MVMTNSLLKMFGVSEQDMQSIKEFMQDFQMMKYKIDKIYNYVKKQESLKDIHDKCDDINE